MDRRVLGTDDLRASPYPCGEPPPPSVCGDESCTGSETNGSCAVDCSNGGEPDENPTVPWVEEQFDAVDDDGTRMSMWFGVPFVGGPIFPNPVPLYPPVGGDWKRPYPSFPLQFASLDRCHLQGAQRLRTTSMACCG